MTTKKQAAKKQVARSIDHRLIRHKAPFDKPLRASMKDISYDEAMIAIEAGIWKCRQLDISCCLVVTDTHGSLVALARMDGARHMTGSHAIGRAKVSGYFGMPAKDLAFIGEKTVLQDIDNYTLRGFTQGGMPLFRDGEVAGGIGCSGGHGKALLGIPDDEVASHAASVFNDRASRKRKSRP